MTVLNKARLSKPFRNRYKQSNGSKTSKRADAPLPLLNITKKIASAAALIAEAEATLGNGTDLGNATVPLRASPSIQKGETCRRKKAVLWGNDPNYKVTPFFK